MRRVSKFSLLVIVVLLLAISVPLVVLAVPASGAVSPDVAAAAPLALADTKWVLSSLGGDLPLPGSPCHAPVQQGRQRDRLGRLQPVPHDLHSKGQ